MRKHKLTDKYPIAGSILTGLLILLLSQLMIAVPVLVERIITGTNSDLLNMLYVIVSGIVLLWLYKKWFAPEFAGVVKLQGLKQGLLMSWLIPVYWIITGVAMALSHTFNLKPLSLTTISASLTAGIIEELVFRHGIISTMFRNKNRKENIIMINLISSAVFGLIHALNGLMGANLAATALQVVTAGCLGVLFAAIFMSTGNILPCMLVHALHDIYAISVSSNVSENGLVTGGLSWSDGIDLLVCVAIAVFAIVHYLSKDKREDIVELWQHIWHHNEFKASEE